MRRVITRPQIRTLRSALTAGQAVVQLAARSEIISPLRRCCRARARGHVRDFSFRVILRECAARVGMSAGTQADAEESLRLRAFSPRLIFLFSPSPSLVSHGTSPADRLLP
jgi:hypothetical protein